MARRPDLTSPAQHRESSKITFPRPVVVHRSFRNRAKAQLLAATTNSGPLPSLTHGTAGQASQRFKHWGVPPRKPGNRVPLSTRALRLTDLALSRQGKEAPPVAANSRGHPEAPLTLQAPYPPGAGPRSSLQLSGGPRKAPRPLISGALAARSTQGKAAPQLLGRAPLLPRERRNLAPTGAAAPRTPRGSRAIRVDTADPSLPLFFFLSSPSGFGSDHLLSTKQIKHGTKDTGSAAEQELHIIDNVQ
ncbi:hypothetical protein NDU88_008509 [Pleurodeles waltl]|uniref:Uncharacterized protein n=1 Tax=Pleurodeles waltl TaxID=8319 RepID=A0AAV7NZ61_PLEWA|nr:hypothetical protein NDU88_008509 [Pleurodeles waltl]